MAHNRAMELLRQFFTWLNRVRVSLEKSETELRKKALVMDHEGKNIVVSVRHETPDGYLCDKQRSFVWYAAWPFCPDATMNEKWFIKNDDPRILSIIDSDAFF